MQVQLRESGGPTALEHEWTQNIEALFRSSEGYALEILLRTPGPPLTIHDMDTQWITRRGSIPVSALFTIMQLESASNARLIFNEFFVRDQFSFTEMASTQTHPK
jgi:hypothetical protein